MYYLSPYKNSELFDRAIEGLIKAGYKGNSSDYYKIIKENKLNGQEIKELMLGKTQSGYFFGNPWSMNRNNNGDVEITDIFGGVIDKGKTWIEGDAICNKFEKRYDGIKDCSDIYKNPEGDDIGLSEYISLTDYWMLPFSIIE